MSKGQQDRCTTNISTSTSSSTSRPLLSRPDSDRWTNDGANDSPSPMRWEFQSYRQDDLAISTIKFHVVYENGEPTHTLHIHPNMAVMLGYLDLDYWLSGIKQTTLWNQNRISRYLRCLREDVVLELMGTSNAVLRDPAFGTSVLREWAVRVWYRYGHSQTGRRAYEESCARSQLPMYDEHFINYGEINV
jgi:hypothetical protein